GVSAFAFYYAAHPAHRYSGGAQRRRGRRTPPPPFLGPLLGPRAAHADARGTLRESHRGTALKTRLCASAARGISATRLAIAARRPELARTPLRLTNRGRLARTLCPPGPSPH